MSGCGRVLFSWWVGLLSLVDWWRNVGVGWLRLALEFILVRMVTVFVILRLVVGDFVRCYGWVI